MRLYHGSTVMVEDPSVSYSKKRGDFGRGFYTTVNQAQAIEWALTKKARTIAGKAIVNVYDFEPPADAKIKVFETVSEEWLDFICECRCSSFQPDFDIIIGPVADDGCRKVLTAYEKGNYTKEEALKRLKIESLFSQEIFLSQEVCDKLDFVESFEVLTIHHKNIK